MVGRGNAGWITSKSGHPCPCENCSQWPPAENTGNRIPAESTNVPHVWTELTYQKFARFYFRQGYFLNTFGLNSKTFLKATNINHSCASVHIVLAWSDSTPKDVLHTHSSLYLLKKKKKKKSISHYLITANVTKLILQNMHYYGNQLFITYMYNTHILNYKCQTLFDNWNSYCNQYLKLHNGNVKFNRPH